MQNSISPVIAMITPGIIGLLMEKRRLSLEEASGLTGPLYIIDSIDEYIRNQQKT